MATSLLTEIKPDSYLRLPNKESVQSFMAFLKEKGLSQSSIVKSCFLKLNNLNEAYIAVICCFGGPKIVEKLNPFIQKRNINQKQKNETKENLSKILNKFNWNIDLQVFQMFQINSKLFGNRYSFFNKNIFPCFLEKQSHNIFTQVTNNAYLNRAKVRIWRLKNKLQQYRQFIRINEKDEQQLIDYSTYVLLAENQNGSYNLGAILVNQVTTERGSNEISNFQIQDIPPASNQKKATNKQSVNFKRKSQTYQSKYKNNTKSRINRKQSKTFAESDKKFRQQKDVKCPCQLI